MTSAATETMEMRRFYRYMYAVCLMCAKQLKDKKCKVFPYSLPSVGPGADPGVQAVSPQVT